MTHLLLSVLLSLSILQASPSVAWSVVLDHLQENRYQLVLTGKVAPDYYVHPLDVEYVGTRLEVAASDAVQLQGSPVQEYTPSDYKGEEVVTGTYVIRQDLLLSRDGQAVEGTVTWSACSGDACGLPEEYVFKVQHGKSVWALILEAVLWGLLMLLTPCVFPMVPMTVSFFLKQSGSPAAGRFRAFMYGVFIVLLYTVPICVIIGLTWALGGAAVTADIFNWLSTHWLPNLIFFVVFMLFAASFFGAFEIVLPASWTTRADEGSGRKGLLGVFFLALTLVLVSFSCTGPIVGTVLIKSTQGEFWVPMVTMLAFSVAFALPFALLAFFPSALKKLPKSGGWLNSVKVSLGFIEIALGLKFLSVADQTYHWNILPRSLYLTVWIVCFTLLGLYLLGKVRFKHDTTLERISPLRWLLVLADFAFVVYLATGLNGAPLKALSGYLPPMEVSESAAITGSGNSVMTGSDSSVMTGPDSSVMTGSDRSSLVALPHGLVGYTSLEEGIAAAQEQGKRVFVDITGHGCVNCREMEARVWSNPEVLKRLREDFVIVSLYVDDKTRLPESQWVTTASGAVLKDVGRVNSKLVLDRFGVNSQPNYFILDGSGATLSGPYTYNLDPEAFVWFLDQ